MGGGGSGGYFPSNVGNGNGSIPCSCENIAVVTPVNSVQNDILITLREGDRLAIQNNNGRLVVVTRDNKIVGALTPPEQARILSCIEQGYSYVAEITRLDGAACLVTVTYGQL